MSLPYVAVVSLKGAILHVLGPFPTVAEASAEGERVRVGVEMFKSPKDVDETAELSVVPLRPNFDSLISSIDG